MIMIINRIISKMMEIKKHKNSQVVVVIVVRLSNKRIQDSLERVSVTRLHLEFLNSHCSMSPSMFLYLSLYGFLRSVN